MQFTLKKPASWKIPVFGYATLLALNNRPDSYGKPKHAKYFEIKFYVQRPVDKLKLVVKKGSRSMKILSFCRLAFCRVPLVSQTINEPLVSRNTFSISTICVYRAPNERHKNSESEKSLTFFCFLPSTLLLIESETPRFSGEEKLWKEISC